MIERDNPPDDTVRLPESQVDILRGGWDGHPLELVSKPAVETHPLDGLMDVIRHGPHSIPGVQCLDLRKLLGPGLESLRNLLNQRHTLLLGRPPPSLRGFLSGCDRFGHLVGGSVRDPPDQFLGGGTTTLQPLVTAGTTELSVD